jgi:hypothetical protein
LDAPSILSSSLLPPISLSSYAIAREISKRIENTPSCSVKESHRCVRSSPSNYVFRIFYALKEEEEEEEEEV